MCKDVLNKKAQDVLFFMRGISGSEQAADHQHESEYDQGDAHDRADDGYRQDYADDHQHQPQDGTDQPAGGFDDPHDQPPDQPEGVEQPVYAFFIVLCHSYLHLNIRQFS
jgi:hypothetical protein